MKRYHTLFFDAGGTIIRPFPSAGAVYAEVAAQYGIELDAARMEDEARRNFAFLKQNDQSTRGPSYALSLDHSMRWWREVVRMSAGGAADSPRFEAFYQAVFREFARYERYTVFPEVKPLFADLARAGCGLGVISNWDPRLRGILQGLGLSEFLHTIVVSGEIGVAKPDPRIFHHARESAMTHHGARDDSLFLHIGDHPIEDAEGALAVGFHARIVDRKKGEDLRKILKDLLPA